MIYYASLTLAVLLAVAAVSCSQAEESLSDNGVSDRAGLPDSFQEISDSPAVSEDTAPRIDETAVNEAALPDTAADIQTPDAAAADTAPAADTLATPDSDIAKSDLERYADCVFDKVNAFRAANGKPAAYLRDTKLDEVGVYYSGYMAKNNVFAHSADGKNFGERLDSFGVKWASAGENLQKNSKATWETACQETVNGSGGWANSTAGHKEAMLGKTQDGTDKGWTHAGVGVAKAGSQWYVAMYFVRY